MNESFASLVILVPIIGAFTIPLFAKISPRMRVLAATIIAFSTSLLAMSLIPFVIGGNEFILRKPLILGFDFVLIVDALSVFMSIAASFIGALIVLYSAGYISHDENQTEYYFMVLLFIGSMMGLVYSANLIFMYIFWEITAICSWRLIGFYRLKEFVVKANKAFLITFLGAVVMLLGFILIYNQTNSFDLTTMRGTMVPGMAVLLILIGMFSKSATLPLHTWLPDAGIAPSTVTSLLHAAVLVKIGVYAYARIFCWTFQMPDTWYQVIPVIVIISSLVAAGAALVENDLKRILAYSTVSQIGYIFLGLSTMNPIGIAGAILFLLMHGLAKGGLFLCAGIVEHNTHKRDIRELGGLIKTMPITAICFLLCALSVIGIPPFGGFFSKFMVIMGAVKAGQFWIAGLGLFIAVLTAVYLFRVFNMVFLGDYSKLDIDIKEKTKSMLFVVIVLAGCSLLAGIFVNYPMKLVNVATSEITRWLTPWLAAQHY
ncbi:MAG: NADH-quinone oxidoreductase subunit L [bacterium]|nr:NADH-quinone oxidoreductase subunit L [bacterium]